MKKATYILFFTCMSLYSFGQEKTKKWKTSLEISLSTLPTIVTSGIDTSFKNSLSANPLIGLRSKKGFGISYSPGFIMGSSQGGIYMHDITVGFEQFNKKSFDYFADFSHFFLTDNKSVPASPITSEFYSVATYKKSWVKPMISMGMGFGWLEEGTSKNFIYDITAAIGISHSFIHEGKKSDFYFTPSLKLNAGTNEYYSFMGGSKYISNSKDFNSYVTNKIGKKNDNNLSLPSLSIRNVEIGARPSYDCGQFNISLATGVFVPVATMTSTITSFWQLRLKYDL